MRYHLHMRDTFWLSVAGCYPQSLHSSALLLLRPAFVKLVTPFGIIQQHCGQLHLGSPGLITINPIGMEWHRPLSEGLLSHLDRF